MHIAPNITIRNRRSGGHWKITEVAQGVVTLTDNSERARLRLQLAEVPLDFEEFGPLYDAPDGNGMLRLERCPFCGSTNLDPAAWMSDADVNNTGPGCNDCGATCESVEKWNARYRARGDRTSLYFVDEAAYFVTPEVRAYRIEWRKALEQTGPIEALKAFDKEFMV